MKITNMTRRIGKDVIKKEEITKRPVYRGNDQDDIIKRN